MNKIILKYSTIVLCLLVLSSCKQDDPEQSTLTNVQMMIASVDPSATVEEETAGVVTVNFNMDEDQIIDTKVAIAIDPTKTTATEGTDFILSTHEVALNAYQRSASFDITVIGDVLAEGDETVAVVISGLQDPFGASNSVTYEMTIKDYVDNEKLILTFDWEGIGFYEGVGYSLCENVDIDIYRTDGMGGDLGIYDGATANCPEVIIMDATWEDGEYIWDSNMWENGFAGLATNTDFPIRIGIDKPGVYNESFTPEVVWNSEELDQATGGNTSFKSCLTVVKAGNVYTVTRPDGSQIVQGFAAPSHKKIASLKVGQ